MPTLVVPKNLVRPKRRPRFGRGRVYCEDRDYESAVAALWRSAGYGKLGGAVGVSIVVPRGVRGDVDNIAKFVMDALRGVAYDDDRQVVELHVRRDAAQDVVTITVEEVCHEIHGKI